MPYFVVRIEHPKADQTVFTVEPSDLAPADDMALFDSTPAVICSVEATDLSAACAAAWTKGKRLLESVDPRSPIYTAEDFHRALDALRPPALPLPSDPDLRPMSSYAAAINEALGTSHPDFAFEGSPWECPDPEEPPENSKAPSPTGHCVYLPADDPCRDHCLFCGLPEERK